jgi:hypothetical protein
MSSAILVGGEGIEPSTSFLSGKRSTSELTTHKSVFADALAIRKAFLGAAAGLPVAEPIALCGCILSWNFSNYQAHLIPCSI